MKLAIISDLHIGARKYRTNENGINKFEQLGYKALEENFRIIKEQKPDLVINAGDTFDVANPHVYAITKYMSAINNLNIPTMTILGNHDFNFTNRKTGCSAVSMVDHTYFADYEIKSFIIDNIQFILMPYIYDTAENIRVYLEKCKQLATHSKKILITHGITDRYSKESLIGDPLSLPDELVEIFDLVIIGHIHTPYSYKQGNTLVISPGGMIDYQADVDRTGPIFLDTDTMEFTRIKVKTPHIVKVSCDEKNINQVLSNVAEDIYKIDYIGDINAIDNDLYITAKNKAVNLTLSLATEEIEEKPVTKLDSFYKWVGDNYPDKLDCFTKAITEVGEC